MRRLFTLLCAVTAGFLLGGCSSSQEPGKEVKDLKARGLKDPDKEQVGPGKEQGLPGSKNKGR